MMIKRLIFSIANKNSNTLKFRTEPAKALVEAAPSSNAIDAFTDFSDKLVAADAVSLHKLKR